MLEWVVTDAQAGSRADVVIAELAQVTRTTAQRLMADESFLINGAPSKPSSRLRPGDAVSGEIPPPIPSHVEPEAIELDIVYEDSDIIVINKPQGLVVHPAPGTPSGTVVNAILAHAADLSGIGGEQRPGIVHRLDKDTSGLLMIAKNDMSHSGLQAQIQARTASRLYLALVHGTPRFNEAEVDAPIGRHPGDRKRMAVLSPGASGARSAQTRLRVLRALPDAALLEATLRTGRTNQIRVHCAYTGHPVLADPVYGVASLDRRWFAARGMAAPTAQMLHAYRLKLTHPRTGEALQFEAPMPEPMRAALLACGGEPVLP
ncbi:MAG: RluA family pseudouridine synthase [Armatimonadetes bacterium]|nr:RluA family pseudouridine synthase [Armatimonadota bacterium]